MDQPRCRTAAPSQDGGGIMAIMHDKGARPMAQKIRVFGINMDTCGRAHYAACTTQGYEASQKEGTMTAPLTETTSALSKVQASKALKLSREGIMAGICGAATIILWFLLLDVLAGHPLYTPNMLGTALFKGGSGLMPLAHVELSLGIVGAFTALHWLVFALIGALASLLLALAEHNPNLGFGVLLFFILSTEGLVGGVMMFAEPVLHALAWQSVLVGNLFAAVTMGGYLWRRHAPMVIYP